MKPQKQDLHNLPYQSFWIASAGGDIPEYGSLNEDAAADVVIVGGGITGITCAYLLAKEGLSVILLESDRIARGATGNTTAKITSQHGLIYHRLAEKMGLEAAEQYAAANEAAITEIRKLTETLKIDCGFTPQPAYLFTESDEFVPSLYDEINTALKLGIRGDFVDSIPLPFTVKGAVRFDGQAQFHPVKYVLALAKAFCDLGGRIFDHTRAVEMGFDDGYVISTGSGKKVSARILVIASHYPFSNKHGMYFTRIYQERSYLMAFKAAEAFPEGMFINAEKPTRSMRSIKTADGELILAAGSHHKTGQCDDTWKNYEALFDFANSFYTISALPYRWSAQDCMTLDQVPYVGYFTEDTPNLYVATGFGKWGMTNSMASGMLLRDLIIKGDSAWKDVYSPSRKTKAASAVSFVTENFNVAKNLVGGKTEPLPKVDDTDLPAGEGRAVELSGKRAGAYRKEDGLLYLVNTTCTHMGCELNWNTAETSWDCPCHGSRFSTEGRVIEGPAVKDLDLDEDVNPVSKLLTEEF